MIAEAVILGAVEAAVYREGDVWRAVRLTADGGLSDCSMYVGLLTNNVFEQQRVTEVLTSSDELSKHLQLWSRRHKALTAVLAGLDQQSSTTTRLKFIQAADQFLTDTDASAFVGARLLGVVPPAVADFSEGISLADKTDCLRVGHLYRQVRNSIGKIRIVHKLLERTISFGYERGIDPAIAKAAMIASGMISDAVLAFPNKGRKEPLHNAPQQTDVRHALIGIAGAHVLVSTFTALLKAPRLDLTTRLPDEYFTTFVSALQDGCQWHPADGILIGLSDVRRLINSIWNAAVDRFPEKLRGRMLPLVNDCVGLLTRVSPPGAVAAAIARIRALLYLSAIREASGWVTWHSRLSNLRQAVHVADRAHFFDRNAQHLEYRLWREIEDVADNLPRITDNLHASTEDLIVKVNLLADAGVVLYFSAIVQAEFYGDRDKALSEVQMAQKYFEDGSHYLQDVPERRRLVAHRWARTLMFKGKLALHSGFGGRDSALESYNQSLSLLQALSPSEYSGSSDPEQGWAANRILQARALIEKARILPASVETRRQIEDILFEVILDRPNDSMPRNLLLTYYSGIEGNGDNTFRDIDEWIAARVPAETANNRVKRAAQNLRYAAACLYASESQQNAPLSLLAIERFAKVLVEQPANMRVVEHLLNLLDSLSASFLDVAQQKLDATLPPLHSSSCSIACAVVRLLSGLGERQLPGPSYPSLALAAMVQGQQDMLDQAASVIRQTASDHRVVRFALELLSKKYFERGITSATGEGLGAANRLLDLALSIDSDDAIWMSRKLNVARLLGLESEVEELTQQAERRFSLDPIIKLHAARLLVSRGGFGKIEEARSLLIDAAAIERADGVGEVHPAILDQLAYISFQQGDLDEAERRYNEILDAKPLDARAHFGLGRAHFERGVAHWPTASNKWLAAARVQAASDESVAGTVFWRTVCSIAGICDARYHRFSPHIRAQLLASFKRMLTEEQPLVSSGSVDALHALGIVDAAVVDSVIEGVSNGLDKRLTRSAAQFLMASTIFGLLGIGATPNIRRSIDWSAAYGVLPEYLAGAKGAYKRAFIRLRLSKIDPGKALDALRASTKVTWIGHWRKLAEHLATAGYKHNYYSGAYALVKQCPKTSKEELEDFVRYVVWLVCNSVHKEISARSESVLDILMPNAGLCALEQIVPLQECNAVTSVSGWADADAVQVIEQEFKGKGSAWRVRGAELIRAIPALPGDKVMAAYGRGGVYFRHQAPAMRGLDAYCYVDLSPGLKEAA